MKSPNHPFDKIFDEITLIVCCGPGGVGKTTVAAALAAMGAERGRRTLVLTIDPARRLATCLGIALGNVPTRVESDRFKGEMWAMMLDASQAFEELIVALSPDQQTVEKVMTSSLYRVFAESMHGTTEYMALETLHNQYSSGRFDLVVLDTPPMSNALDFFKIPNRASWLFDDRIMRWFLPNVKRGFRARLHPGAIVVALLKRLAGSSLVNDITEFFSALETLHAELKNRGDDVSEILRDKKTGYLIVTAADDRRIDEARFLDRQLGQFKQSADLFVVNRSHHHLAGALDALRSDPSLDATLTDALIPEAIRAPDDFDGLRDLLDRLQSSARLHLEQLQRLIDDVGKERVCAVAEVPEDIHDIDGLLALGELVVPSSE